MQRSKRSETQIKFEHYAFWIRVFFKMFHDLQVSDYLIFPYLHLMNSFLHLEEDNINSFHLIIEATFLVLEHIFALAQGESTLLKKSSLCVFLKIKRATNHMNHSKWNVQIIHWRWTPDAVGSFWNRWWGLGHVDCFDLALGELKH